MTVQAVWRDAIGLENLKAAGRKVLKIDGKQIVLFLSGDRILACNNRCPHEGYPLAEGNLADGSCVLTCNWHNWKFDLDSGETLVGGDTLRRYPTRVVDGRVELDVADPPADEVIQSALANLEDCFDRHEYDRMAREIARLMKAGGDPLDALRRTIAVTADRFEYGASHALPASADWLDLRAETPDDPVLMFTSKSVVLPAEGARKRSLPSPAGDGAAEDADSSEDDVPDYLPSSKVRALPRNRDNRN
jgi:nitrite reductase/ring-hydroxylating ferredoxin subunit